MLMDIKNWKSVCTDGFYLDIMIVMCEKVVTHNYNWRITNGGGFDSIICCKSHGSSWTDNNKVFCEHADWRKPFTLKSMLYRSLQREKETVVLIATEQKNIIEIEIAVLTSA